MRSLKSGQICIAAAAAAAAVLMAGVLTVSAAETGTVTGAPGTQTEGTAGSGGSAGTGSGTAGSGGSSGTAAEQGPDGKTAGTGTQIDTQTLTYDVSRFVLPSDAKSLVVVEGFAVNGGKETYSEGFVADESRWNKARVTAFVKNADGTWLPVIRSAAVMGWGGMKADRHSGDGSTPIGLWKADTPFGRGTAETGFPTDYVKIDPEAKNQFWSDLTNRLEVNADVSAQSGERLWEDWASGIYDYCLNSGFNKDKAQGSTGTALFLHCTKAGKPSTAGCVAMDPAAMKGILRLYAGGGLYIAQAPESRFETVYTAYSSTGAAAPGTFTASQKQMPETATVVLR